MLAKSRSRYAQALGIVKAALGGFRWAKHGGAIRRPGTFLVLEPLEARLMLSADLLPVAIGSDTSANSQPVVALLDHGPQAQASAGQAPVALDLTRMAGARSPTMNGEPAQAAQVGLDNGYAFERNMGQTAAQVDYLARGPGYTLFLTSGGATLRLGQGASTDGVLSMTLLGANPQAAVTATNPLSGVSNYLSGVGSAPAIVAANFAQVQYHDVYAGIDLGYHGNAGQLEHDWTLAPGADVGAIRMAYDGVTSLDLDADGNLAMHSANGDLTQKAPQLYQTIGGRRQTVAGGYVLLGGNEVGYWVGAHEDSAALVIDPVLVY
jgi:hypothetical protein